MDKSFDLVTLLRELRPGCIGCARRRASLTRYLGMAFTWFKVWVLVTFSPWRLRWVYGFCTATDNWTWGSISHAVYWSYRYKSSVLPVNETLLYYFDAYSTIRNPTTRAELDKAITKIINLD